MDNSWLTWDQAMQEYKLTRDKLVDYCIAGQIPLYNANRARVYPIGHQNPFACEQPHIVWGRIPLAENEVLSFHEPQTFSRIVFKGFSETGDFLIFRKDCVPTLQDEILFRVLEKVHFPQILTPSFWESLQKKASIGNRVFIPQEELRYPSIFMRQGVFDIERLERGFAKLKETLNETSPCIELIEETNILTSDDYLYEIGYSINKEGFAAAEDKIVLRFEDAEPGGNGCESSQDLHVRYVFFSDTETNTWVKYHRRSFLMETVNAPIMRLSITQSNKEPFLAPSIQAISQVTCQYKPESEVGTTDDHLDRLYQFASFLTYTGKPQSIEEQETVLLEGAAYCISNGIYKNADEAYQRYLSQFVFNMSDLSMIGVRTISFIEFKDKTIREIKRSAHQADDKYDKIALLALAIRLDTCAKSSDVYAKVFEELKLKNTGKAEEKGDGAKRKAMSDWLDRAKQWATDNEPTLLPFPNWRTYTNQQAQRGYFSALAARRGVTLVDTENLS